MHSLVLSHLDYANVLLVGVPKYELEKLQSIQKRAAKITLGRSKYNDSATKALFDLKWLPIEYKVKLKILSYVYKALNDEAPEYLSSLLKFKKTDYSTRAEDNLELEVPKTGSYGNKAFC